MLNLTVMTLASMAYSQVTLAMAIKTHSAGFLKVRTVKFGPMEV